MGTRQVETDHSVRIGSRKCGDSYEHGIMAGCLSVMGNDKEVCNLAEDA